MTMRANGSTAMTGRLPAVLRRLSSAVRFPLFEINPSSELLTSRHGRVRPSQSCLPTCSLSWTLLVSYASTPCSLLLLPCTTFYLPLLSHRAMSCCLCCLSWCWLCLPCILCICQAEPDWSLTLSSCCCLLPTLPPISHLSSFFKSSQFLSRFCQSSSLVFPA